MSVTQIIKSTHSSSSITTNRKMPCL